MKTKPVSSSTRGHWCALLVGLLFSQFGLVPVTRAADLSEDLQIFGHLTQAWGKSDLGSIQGASEGGSTDLRKIAIQFRWQKSEKESVVVQLSHERFGDDIFSPVSSDVEIDWAFYERRIGPNTALKVGRLNVPLGIYNEIRDVGTLLPFFNLPISFYGGVLSSAETVDGISFARTTASRSDWALESELYFGGWDMFQQQVDADDEFGLVNLEARAEEGLGIQLWLDTPVRGLRVGAGALTWLLDGELSVHGRRDRWNTAHLSIDASGDKWVFRAEARRWEFEQDFGGFLALSDPIPGEASREGYYVQLGCWMTPKVGLFAQREGTRLGNDVESLPEIEDFHRDLALSFNYRHRPDLLVKVELHNSDTRFPLGASDSAPNGGGPFEVNWMIVGLSVSF